MDKKPWYLSKTIIGAVVTTLASLAAVFGIDIGAGLQAEIVDTILVVATATGAVLTVVGRVRAKTGIALGADRSGPPGGMALALLLALALAPALSACAYQAAETPVQKVYALQWDYASAQMAAAAYVESARADPSVVRAIQDADAAAADAIAAARQAVRAGDSPTVPALIATARHAVAQLRHLVPALRGPPDGA